MRNVISHNLLIIKNERIKKEYKEAHVEMDF